MSVVSEGSVQVVAQSSVVQVPDMLSGSLVWFTIVCRIYLVSVVYTKCYLLHTDACIALILCTCDVCRI